MGEVTAADSVYSVNTRQNVILYLLGLKCQQLRLPMLRVANEILTFRTLLLRYSPCFFVNIERYRLITGSYSFESDS